MQSALIAPLCGSVTAPVQETVALKQGLQTAPAVVERNEKTETGTTDATIEDIDLGPKRDGETEVVPRTGRKSLEESEATRGKEQGEDTRMQSETG